MRHSGRDPAAFLRLTRELGFDAWLVDDYSHLQRFDEAELCAATSISTMYLTRPVPYGSE